MTSTGLGGRFGKLNGAVAAVSKEPEPAKEPPKQEAPKVTPATGGLGGRFAAKVNAEPTEPVVQQKAKENGISSSVSPAQAAANAAAPAASGTLMSRLQTVNKAKADAVQKAADDASKTTPNPVTVTGQLATGINPPDAAPEWTPEQQAAEAAKLAAKQGSVQSDVAPDPKADTVPADPETTTVANTSTSASTNVIARATPRRSKKAAEVAVDQMAANADAKAASGQYTVATALAEIDAVTVKLMTAGFRKEASVIMRVASEIG